MYFPKMTYERNTVEQQLLKNQVYKYYLMKSVSHNV